MSTKISTVALATSLAFLVACGSNKPKTIGSLAYTPPVEEEAEPQELSHEQVRDEYSELVDLFEDEHLKEQIERRIADVYMMEGVQDQYQGATTTSYYVEAIKAYRNILERYPDSPDNAEVLYQLAKAYDLEGDQAEAMKMLAELTQRHPHYVNIAEAHFRMGDIHFNNSDYPQAQTSYAAVLEHDNERLEMNARYMLGWSYYKQLKFRNSLLEFAVVLDELLDNVDELEALGDAQRPMATDTLHSMSLAFDKVGGAEAIATIPRLKGKDYIWMLYNNLGEYYLEKELYEASASTFRTFVNQHSNSDKAPVLHSKIIDTYVEGGFPTLALEEKETYVAAYGIHSPYASRRDTMQAHVESSLRTYLDELARHHYNLGRGLQGEDELDEGTAGPAEGFQGGEGEEIADIEPEAIAAYEKAASFYGQYAETFPEDERIDEIYFLMSEALFLAQRYDDAIPGYERVAYHPRGTSAQQYANNAGYAAIIAYQEHIASLSGGGMSSARDESDEVKVWQAQAVESMLNFANHFHADHRAVSVLTNAAEYLFSLNEYERALEVSNALIANNEDLDKSLKKTAYGIVAHSHFNLGDYHNAELNYIHQRDLVAPSSEEYQKVSERLATSMYRKSEQIDESGESEAAVTQLLRIKELTPDSSLRVPAQYDAATMLIEMEQWGRAITELKELVTLYPEHELAVEFPRRLAFSYEQNEDWSLAAVSYQQLAEEDPDEDVSREALFVAATMFENAKNYEQAIEHFRRYANTYETPTDMLMEARYNLAVNYQRVGDTDRHRFWLDRLVEGERQFESTDRNRWLSGWANAKYGDYYAEQFRSYRLSVPLVESLPRKNELLERASRRYEAAAAQGVLEFSTMASFKMGELYRQLARDLRASPVPSSLSQEERQIYAEIIEEQAAPFDELSMELYQANIDRAWSGRFNQWIDQSFAAMRVLHPARFNKAEIIVSYGDEIR